MPESRKFVTSVIPAHARIQEVRYPVIPAHAGIQEVKQVGTMEKQPCVYLLASKRNGTLYTGVTSNLIKRAWEHKNNLVEGFTSKYSVHTLVWYELHDTMESAIQREKAIKNWKRAWKIKTIEEQNPRWEDLYQDLI
jgi:putative endonuclease